MREVVLRRATDQDEAFLEGLFRIKASEELGFPVDDPLIDMQVRAHRLRFGGLFADADSWVIQADSERVGAFQLEETESRHLSYFVVLPQHRGLGIGGEVLRQLQAQGGCITLYVSPFNPARRLYERVGFRREREEAASIFMLWQSPQVGWVDNPMEHQPNALRICAPPAAKR
jgi:ribosomal protein S18 acetylase RimI-like enzyme